MLLSGFKEEIYEKGLREEGREEGMKEGRREGLEEGMKEGREEGIREGMETIVMNLLRNNTTEFVAEQCGLELDYVNSIKEEQCEKN